MKLSFSLIIDVCFSAFISFLLAFVVLNYFIDKRFAIAFSVILSIPVAIIAFKKITEKRKKNTLKKAEKDALDIMLSQLAVYTQTEQNEFFCHAFIKAGYAPTRKNGAIYILKEKCATLIKMGAEGAKKADVVRAFNLKGNIEKSYIFTSIADKELEDFCKRFNGKVTLVKAESVFKFLSSIDFLPKIKFNFPEKVPLKKQISTAFFSKKKAGKYFSFGLIFLMMSYFVPIKLYYIICGSVFLLTALILKLFGREELS